MWGHNSGGAWSQQQQQQWPMQQAMYQNIPHEQIDWAALAQQWIQMKESMGSGNGEPGSCGPSGILPGTLGPGPPGMMRGGQAAGNGAFRGRGAPPSLPSLGPRGAVRPTMGINVLGDMGSLSAERNSSSEGGNQGVGGWNAWHPGWSGSGVPNWPTGGPPSVMPSSEANLASNPDSFDYDSVHGNQGYASHGFDYSQSADQFEYNQSAPDDLQYNQYWTQGGGPLPILTRDQKEKFDREDSPGYEDESSVIDASKRKNLPAWIRQGLEKMERDKQKKLERERMLREREERIQMEREREHAITLEMQQQGVGGGDAAILRRSKFESDSEDNDDDSTSSPSMDRRSNYRSRSPVRRTPSPVEPLKTEQEKLEDLMTRVRRMLTEILLEVTNEEILAASRDVLARAHVKGLGEYGSGNSSDQEDEDEDAEDVQEFSRDSDAELQESIRKRKQEFAERERQLMRAFQGQVAGDAEWEASVEGRENKKGGAEVESSSGIKSQSVPHVFLGLSLGVEKEKYHFEKKYAAIPGLGIASEVTDDDQSKKQASKPSGKDAGGGKNSVSDGKTPSGSSRTKKETRESDSSSSSLSKRSRSRSSSSSSRSSKTKRHVATGSSSQSKRSEEKTERSRSRSRERRRQSPSRDRSSRRERSSERPKARSRSRDRRGRRSSSKSSSSRSRSRDRSGRRRNSGNTASYRRRSRSSSRDRGGHDHRRRSSRSHSRLAGSPHRSRRPSSPRRQRRSPSVSRRDKSRGSRSDSHESSDRRTGKKSSDKSRV